MALLHRVRHPLSGGLRPSRRLTPLLILLTQLFAGCAEPQLDPDFQPEGVLRDSLGLTSQDRVHVVRMRHAEGREQAIPDSVLVHPGDWVDFLGDDGWLRVVEFVADSLDEAPRDFLAGTGIDLSPPLLGRGVHWVVPFEAAPPGRYVYRITGAEAPGWGAVVVAPPG